MKIAIVYEKEHHKLQNDSYSWIYKGMLDALVRRFEEVQCVHDSCSAEDIDADLIMIYDIVSTHHITIDGLAKHPAVKMSYLCDTHQFEHKGVYHQFNKPFHKLGGEKRVQRAKERGIQYFVMPMRDAYFKDLGPFIGDDAEKMLLFFPPAPEITLFHGRDVPIMDRERVCMGTGATWDANLGAYEFRKWMYGQPFVHLVNHCLADKKTPMARDWGAFLSNFAGGLALNDYHPVPKYFELPLAGCVTFVQPFDELKQLGYKDYENCVLVTKQNCEARIRDYLEHMDEYQGIATAGQQLVSENYTADHFAEFIYKSVEKHAEL